MHEYILFISSKQLNHLVETRNKFVTLDELDSKGRQYENSAIIV